MGIRSFLSRLKKPKSVPNSSRQNPILPRIGSGSYSKESHMEQLEQVFLKFDVNGDGKISWSELGSIMASLGHSASKEELQRMVREADSDGDGFIDLKEFIELNTTGVDSVAIMEDLKDAFLVYDLDRNGSISPEELQKVLRNLGDNLSVSDCKLMISRFDQDGDGLVSFEEFKDMMMGSLPQR